MQLPHRRGRGQHLHLADGDLIEPLEPVALRQRHVNEFSVHALDISQHKELLNGGVVAHVAVELGIGVAPLFRRLTKKGHVQQIGLVGVGAGGLRGRDLRRDEVGLDGVGVDAVVELGESAVEIPSEREAAVFVVLEAAKFFDQVNLERWAYPHAELEGDVRMSEGAAVPASRSLEADGVGFLHPFLNTDLVAVQAGLTFNCGEFAIIKTGVEHRFPDAKELHRVTVSQPVRDKKLAILGLQHVRERKVITLFIAEDGHGSAVDFDGGAFRFLHSLAPILLRCSSTRAASTATSMVSCGSGVAFGEFADAASEGLRDAVELALHGGLDAGQPFVVHHKGLDFCLGERGVLGVELGFKIVLRGLEPGSGVGLLVEECGVGIEGLAFVGVVLVLADFLEAGLHAFSGDLLLLTLAFDDFGEQPLLPALFLAGFVELLLNAGEFGFERGDCILLDGKVAGDEQRGGDEVGLEAALALFKVFLLGPDEFVFFVFHLHDLARLRTRLPAGIGDEVAIVLHGLGPVIHEVLIDIVGIEERRGLKGGEQVLGDAGDERLGVAVLGEALELRDGGGLPLGEELPGLGGEGGELRVGEDDGLDFSLGWLNGGVAGAGRLCEQGGAQAGHDLPVVAEGIQIALGDAAAQVAVDVLQILRLGAVDVAREVEVEVVLRVGNFRERHHACVARIAFILAGKGVDDLVEVLLAEAVLRAVLFKTLGRINHEDALAGGGVFLVEHKDAGGDAGAVKEIGGQANDGLQVTRADELLADDGLSIAAEEHAVRKNAGAFAGALQRADDVEQECVVALLGWWHPPNESLVGVAFWGQTRSPSLD